jgi:hypothetical protein
MPPTVDNSLVDREEALDRLEAKVPSQHLDWNANRPVAHRASQSRIRLADPYCRGGAAGVPLRNRDPTVPAAGKHQQHRMPSTFPTDGPVRFECEVNALRSLVDRSGSRRQGGQ